MEHEFVSGFENWNEIYSPITALMGAEKNNKIIKDLLEYYETNSFLVNNKPDMTPNTRRMTEYFENEFGVKKPYNPNEKLELCPNSIIYPWYYFCKPLTDKENFAIHHFDGSWLENYNRKEIIEFNNYRLIRFKQNKNKPKDTLTYYPNEKIIFEKQISQNKYISLVKISSYEKN